MPLSGEKKRLYQREYMRMRRRRAAEKKKVAEPSVDQSAATKPGTGEETARIRELEVQLARECARREAAESDLAKASHVTKPLTKQNAGDAGTVASLEARILELEAKLAHERHEHAATDQRWRAAFVAPYAFAGVGK